jgi:hypothetical protein
VPLIPLKLLRSASLSTKPCVLPSYDQIFWAKLVCPHLGNMKAYGGGGSPSSSSFIIRMDEYNQWLSVNST